MLAAHRQMLRSDLQAGVARYANADFPCTIGVFTIQQILTADGGGLTPVLMGTLEIAKGDLPDQLQFRSEQPIIVTPKIGIARNCRIHSLTDTGPLWQLTLKDLNQGA